MIGGRLLVVGLLVQAASLALAEPPPLRVKQGEGIVEVDNGLVKARLTVAENGLKQEYLAARGADWVLLAEGLRSRKTEKDYRDVSVSSQAGSLYDTSIDPAHRFLVSEALQRIVRVEKEAESAQVVLSGQSGQTMIEQLVVLRRGQPFLHIEVNARLTGNPPKLEYLLVPLVVAMDGKLDAVHAPTYEPTADSVIGDRVFFAPVVCVQQGGLLVNRCQFYLS